MSREPSTRPGDVDLAREMVREATIRARSGIALTGSARRVSFREQMDLGPAEAKHARSNVKFDGRNLFQPERIA